MAAGCSRSHGVLMHFGMGPQRTSTPHGAAVLCSGGCLWSSETSPGSGTGRFTRERRLLCRAWWLQAYGHERKSVCSYLCPAQPWKSHFTSHKRI